MYHKEGGWPTSIDPTEQQDILKYRKKVEKDPNFTASV